MKAKSTPKSGQPYPQIFDYAEKYCKSKTRQLFFPVCYEENHFITLTPGEIGEEEKKVKIEGKQTR
jgi:hypothetical protein